MDEQIVIFRKACGNVPDVPPSSPGAFAASPNFGFNVIDRRPIFQQETASSQFRSVPYGFDKKLNARQSSLHGNP
jgi:hypothetical protein